MEKLWANAKVTNTCLDWSWYYPASSIPVLLQFFDIFKSFRLWRTRLIFNL